MNEKKLSQPEIQRTPPANPQKGPSPTSFGCRYSFLQSAQVVAQMQAVALFDHHSPKGIFCELPGDRGVLLKELESQILLENPKLVAGKSGLE